ncbi:MAG: twin-arginine translocase TatA/TatE family subunit [Micavibrio sp.]|nr:twin-arginine translocase TatA/TatE family subunit [Micavibrio sp.]|tara:strand:- start:146 stop:331 length:186 start_codon:yes stop_codon:yes gene_type:complete
MAPGPMQILIVVMLILVVFGASRLPGIAENLAKGINSFKKGLKDGDEDLKKSITDESEKPN